MVTTPSSRFLIYPHREAKVPLCQLAADGKRAAMKKARSMFRIGKGAFAVPATLH